MATSMRAAGNCTDGLPVWPPSVILWSKTANESSRSIGQCSLSVKNAPSLTPRNMFSIVCEHMFPTRKAVGRSDLQDSVISSYLQANLCGKAATY